MALRTTLKQLFLVIFEHDWHAKCTKQEKTLKREAAVSVSKWPFVRVVIMVLIVIND